MFTNLGLISSFLTVSRRVINPQISGKRFIRGRTSNAVKWYESEVNKNQVKVTPLGLGDRGEDSEQNWQSRKLRHSAAQSDQNYRDNANTAFSPVPEIMQAQLSKQKIRFESSDESFLPQWKSDKNDNWKEFSTPSRPNKKSKKINAEPKNNTPHESELLSVTDSNIETSSEQSNDLTVRKHREKKHLKFPLAGKVLPSDVTIENQYTKLCEVMTPMYKVPYDVQLKIKYKKYIDVLKTLRYLLKEKTNTKIDHKNAMACDLTFVRPAPQTEAYRNKDEYSIWDGSDGNPKTVGFFVGSPGQQAVCVAPDELINTKASHKLVARKFQEYIRNSAYGVCKSFSDSDEGIYRNILVRSNRENQVMAIVKIHPKNLTADQIAQEMSHVRQFFMEGPGKECNLHSLYFQASIKARSTSEEAPYHLLAGEPYLYETILGKRLRVSPDAFVQINSAASEVLYTTVLELIQPTQKTIILDLCSGAGAVSIAVAPHVKKVIGIELIKQAVEDAEYNAGINNVNNATFLCGRAEVVLPQVMDDLFSTDVVAVVNPDRGGIHFAAIRALRTCKAVTRVVYMSCMPEGQSMKNFIDLCRNKGKGLVGQPFTPTVAAPVDMFPHTNHCELVILFER